MQRINVRIMASSASDMTSRHDRLSTDIIKLSSWSEGLGFSLQLPLDGKL